MIGKKSEGGCNGILHFQMWVSSEFKTPIVVRNRPFLNPILEALISVYSFEFLSKMFN